VFTSKQADVFINADARWNILSGAVSSGKTWISYWLLLKRARNLPPGPCLLIGKTERTLRRNVLDPMAELFGTEVVSGIYGDGEVKIAGRRFYAVGANDEKAVRKIQGLSLVYAYCDEFATYPETFVGMLKSRLRMPGACCDATCNPEGPYHHIKTEFLDRSDELDLKHWHFRLDDNTFLDPDYARAIKTEYRGVWYQRYIEGLWVAAEGAIYDMFIREIGAPGSNVTNDAPKPLQWWVAVDYGTTNPFHAVAGCEELIDGKPRLHIAHEWRYQADRSGRTMTDAEYAQALRTWLVENHITPRFLFVDPSAASFIEACRRANVPGIWGADNAVLDGIRRTARLMAAGLLVVNVKCEHLLREISGYVWDSKAQEHGEDKPLKANDHGVDAMRYLVNGTAQIWGRWMKDAH